MIVSLALAQGVLVEDWRCGPPFLKAWVTEGLLVAQEGHLDELLFQARFDFTSGRSFARTSFGCEVCDGGLRRRAIPP